MGEQTYKWAALCDKFNCLPAALADLTDAQMDELLLYPRDKDGALKPPDVPQQPPAPPTAESRLATIDQLEAMKLITPAKAAELREQVRNG